MCVSDEIDYVKTQQVVPDPQLPNSPITYNNMICDDGSGRSVIEKYKGKHPYLLADDNNVYYLNSDSNIVLYSTMRKPFREEILSKCILSGITPLFVN